MGIADEIKGNPFKSLPKPVVAGGIAVTALLTGYLLYSHHKKTGSWFGGTGTSSAGNPTTIDPVTGMAYSQDGTIDPITGQSYLAEATQYGSVQAAESSVSAYGGTSDTGTGIGVQPASPGAGTSTLASGAVAVSTYTSNAAWAQAAIAGLEDISGGPSYNGTDIATAIGDYLQGEPITAAQIQVVNVALSEFPIPSPLPVVRKPVAPTGTTQVTVPDAKGVSVEEGSPLFTEKGLKVALSPNTNPGAVRIIQSTSPSAGAKVNPGSTVTLHWTPEAASKKGK